MKDSALTPLHNDAPKAERQDPYAAAGVDIDAGNAVVKAIAPFAKATARAGADASLGGFGALFDLKAAGFKDPILVTTTDGVGTKLKVAIESGLHKTVGIDLVAMCVNDLVVQGAEPLLFLDYFASGKTDVTRTAEVIAGIAEGCRLSGCALVGGETAEMPGMYQYGDYDLAGFSVGAVERGSVLPRADVAVGDVVLGLASSGAHSNGFSLIRKIVTDKGLNYDAPAPFDATRTLGAALMEPTRLYVHPALALARAGIVKAMAHITGGGLIENIPRVLPDGLGVQLKAFTLPPLFAWLAKAGNLSEHDMARTFNCGYGLVVIVSPEEADRAKHILAPFGIPVTEIGHITSAQNDADRVILGP